MYQILLFHIYIKLNMFRASVLDNVHQLHVKTTFHIWKITGCQCSFRLLMMGGVSPETCWASYNYGIIKIDTLLHLVGFFFMNCATMHRSTNVRFVRRVFLQYSIIISGEFQQVPFDYANILVNTGCSLFFIPF